MQRRAVEGFVAAHPPRTFGLISFAISRPSELTQRCNRQDRISALIFFRASLLIAGWNEVNRPPSFRRARLGRNVNPRNVNDVCSCEPRAAVVAGRRWSAGMELADLEMLKGIGLPAAGETVLLPVISNSQDMTELGDRLDGPGIRAFPACWSPTTGSTPGGPTC
jgi:hypothetical protein